MVTTPRCARLPSDADLQAEVRRVALRLLETSGVSADDPGVDHVKLVVTLDLGERVPRAGALDRLRANALRVASDAGVTSLPATCAVVALARRPAVLAWETCGACSACVPWAVRAWRGAAAIARAVHRHPGARRARCKVGLAT